MGPSCRPMECWPSMVDCCRPTKSKSGSSTHSICRPKRKPVVGRPNQSREPVLLIRRRWPVHLGCEKYTIVASKTVASTHSICQPKRKPVVGRPNQSREPVLLIRRRWPVHAVAVVVPLLLCLVPKRWPVLAVVAIWKPEASTRKNSLGCELSSLPRRWPVLETV
jgi:hypothetical protein